MPKGIPKEKVEEKVEEKKVGAYIFTSKIDFTLGLKSAGFVWSEDNYGNRQKKYDPSSPSIKCPFTGKHFILTDAFAAEAQLSKEEIFKMMLNHPDYGVTFKLAKDGEELKDIEPDIKVTKS